MGRTGRLPLSLDLVLVVSAVADGVVVGCGVRLLLGVVDVVVGGGGGGGVDDVVAVLVGGWVRDVVERRTPAWERKKTTLVSRDSLMRQTAEPTYILCPGTRNQRCSSRRPAPKGRPCRRARSCRECRRRCCRWRSSRQSRGPCP